MYPSPIPDDEIWEGAERHVIAPPGGDMLHPTIRAVEMLIDRTEDGQRYCARIVLDDADVAQINMGRRVFWYSQHGEHLHPFSIGWGDDPAPYEGAPDPYPNELSADEVAALPECPGWMFKHSSAEVEVPEKVERKGDWVRPKIVRLGPWCECGRTYRQHSITELKK